MKFESALRQSCAITAYVGSPCLAPDDVQMNSQLLCLMCEKVSPSAPAGTSTDTRQVKGEVLCVEYHYMNVPPMYLYRNFGIVMPIKLFHLHIPQMLIIKH
jgi:hypothetical protein